MLKNIYIYGCSHSWGTTHDGRLKPYGNKLANLLNIPNIKNYGQPSSGNEFIRKKIINHFFNDEISKNSLIVVQLTQFHRKSYQLIHDFDKEKFDTLSLESRVGRVDDILHIMGGMFNRDDSHGDKQLLNYSDTYHERLSGEDYLMYDDIFSTYCILNFISSQIKNVKFLILSWPELKEPFYRFVPKELSNIWNWSLENELTEHHIKDNKDYHLSQNGHDELGKKIFNFLEK